MTSSCREPPTHAWRSPRQAAIGATMNGLGHDCRSAGETGARTASSGPYQSRSGRNWEVPARLADARPVHRRPGPTGRRRQPRRTYRNRPIPSARVAVIPYDRCRRLAPARRAIALATDHALAIIGTHDSNVANPIVRIIRGRNAESTRADSRTEHGPSPSTDLSPRGVTGSPYLATQRLWRLVLSRRRRTGSTAARTPRASKAGGTRRRSPAARSASASRACSG